LCRRFDRLEQHAFGFFDLGSSALRRGVDCGFGALFGLPLATSAELKYWLFLPLEAGVAAFFKRRWFVPLIVAGAAVEVWPWRRLI
jgi:hypothetical protein